MSFHEKKNTFLIRRTCFGAFVARWINIDFVDEYELCQQFAASPGRDFSRWRPTFRCSEYFFRVFFNFKLRSLYLLGQRRIGVNNTLGYYRPVSFYGRWISAFKSCTSFVRRRKFRASSVIKRSYNLMRRP